MQNHGNFQRLGQTQDDAAGEAFDKAARLLGLPFPGGPEIERAARRASTTRVEPFPRARLVGKYDFSFSGLKTAVLHRVRDAEALGVSLSVIDTAREFQAAVVDVLVEKTAAAAADHNARTVIVAGGVAANGALRAALRERCPAPVRWPPPSLCTDNAAMIGAAAYFKRDRADLTLAFDLFSTSGVAPFTPGRG